MSLYLTPYRPTTSLRAAMDRLFDESFVRPLFEERYALAMDVQAKDDEFVLTAAAPGFQADELDISVLEEVVTIKAEHKQAVEQKDENYLLRELRYGAFSRSVTLPAPVDAARVEAHLADGLLTLHLPRAESAKIKTIKVKAK